MALLLLVSNLANDGGAAEECRPRLYVYRLPEAYRDPTESTNNMPADGIGPPLHIQQHIGMPLWNTEQYSLASLVHERGLAYRCRTHDPAEADLFLVPAYRGRMTSTVPCAEAPGSRLKLLQRIQIPLHGRNASSTSNSGTTSGTTTTTTISTDVASRRLSRALRSGTDAVRPLTTLDARGGADHIILNPRNGEPWDKTPFCELMLSAPQLGAAQYLSMEAHPHNASWVYPEAYCGKVCVPAYRPQLLSEHWYWSVPWPSMVHLDVTTSRLPWESTHARANLVAAHFNTKHSPILPKPTLYLRDALLEQCRAQPARCRASRPYGDRPEDTALLYWQSTFCLQPGGDTVSRKGIVDALLLGCIPVLFHEGQVAQWPWHWGHWVRSATVLLNQSAVRKRELDAIGALAAIPAARIEAMRVSLREHAHSLQYSAVDTSLLPPRLRRQAAPDAFDVIVDGAWRVSRDRKLQALGRTLQRHKKGQAEAAQRRWALQMGAEVDEQGGDGAAEVPIGNGRAAASGHAHTKRHRSKAERSSSP